MDVLENMEKISIKLPSCGFSFEVSFFPEHFVKATNFLLHLKRDSKMT